MDYDPTSADRIIVGTRSVLVFEGTSIAVFEGTETLYSIKGIKRLQVEISISKVTKIYYPGPDHNSFAGYGMCVEDKIKIVHKGQFL